MAKIITPKMEQLCFDETKTWVDLIETARKVQKSNQRFSFPEQALAVLASLPQETWEDGKTFIDTECGIGQMIIPVAIIKRELGHNEILSSIFGTEIVEENVKVCRQRLLDVCGHTDENIMLVERNILYRDSLKYNFEFES